RRGLSIADGTPVHLIAPPGQTTRLAAVSEGQIEFPIIVPAGSNSVMLTVSCKSKEFSFKMDRAAPQGVPLRGVFLRNELSGVPIANASILRGAVAVQSGSRVGLYLIPDDSGAVHIDAPGFQPKIMYSLPDTLSMVPWFKGKLFATRFLIDPQGGPPAISGAGRLGLSGAHVNLLVAKYLEGYLQRAGAAVLLTRSNEEIRTVQDIVTMANRFHADRYIELRHGRSAADDRRVVRAFHFPGSRLGPDFANNVSRSLSDILGVPLLHSGELVTYPLQQTACPAIVIEAPSLLDMEEELRLSESWYQRLQAYGIFLGILKHFGIAQSTSLSVTVTGARDPSNWLVIIDGSWKLLTNPHGIATFQALSGGEHRVDIQRGPAFFSKMVELSPDGPNDALFDVTAE
ncbi:MAG: N-acetylmuramoyl-L-alanine amidase, partial [Candidatus Latescibacterota bacterium]